MVYGRDRLAESDVLSKDLAAYIEAQRRDDRQDQHADEAHIAVFSGASLFRQEV